VPETTKKNAFQNKNTQKKKELEEMGQRSSIQVLGSKVSITLKAELLMAQPGATSRVIIHAEDKSTVADIEAELKQWSIKKLDELTFPDQPPSIIVDANLEQVAKLQTSKHVSALTRDERATS